MQIWKKRDYFKTYVNVKFWREDRTLDFFSSNVSPANCGSSLIVILYLETNMASTAMLSVSANLKKKKRHLKKKAFIGQGAKSIYFRPMHARAPAYFDNEKDFEKKKTISHQHWTAKRHHGANFWETVKGWMYAGHPSNELKAFCLEEH